MTGPLTRRRRALELDEDTASDWAPSELARLEDAAREKERARDRQNVETGRRLLRDYLAPGIGYREALRAYMADLMTRRES